MSVTLINVGYDPNQTGRLTYLTSSCKSAIYVGDASEDRLPMTCSGCGFELSPDFAFCPHCGRRQPTACLACGMPCEADFAFCPRCGSALSTNSPPVREVGAPAGSRIPLGSTKPPS